MLFGVRVGFVFFENLIGVYYGAQTHTHAHKRTHVQLKKNKNYKDSNSGSLVDTSVPNDSGVASCRTFLYQKCVYRSLFLID